MKKLLFSLSTLFAFTFSQAQSDYYFEEFLKEKVRSPKIRTLLKEIKAKKDAGQDFTAPYNELQAVLELSKSIHNNVGSGAKAPGFESEYEFGEGGEPFIAVNPNNSNHMAVTYMDFMVSGQTSSIDMPVFVTTDGGQTWTQSDISTEQTLLDKFNATPVGGGDPIFAFDSSGTLHMTWIYAYTTGGFNFAMDMFYAYSTNGGLNFTIPTDNNIHQVYSGSIFTNDILDRQWMDVDATGGTYNDNIYMSALYGGNSLTAAGEVIFVKSPGVNQFNNVPVTGVPATSTQQATQFGNVKVSDDGAVHMTCMRLDQQTQAGQVLYVKSTDGGVTYSAPLTIANATSGFPSNGFSPQLIAAKVHNRENSAVSLAVEGNNIYAAWSDMANGDLKSYYAYSNDGGTTWVAPVEINVFGSDFYYVMPNLAADAGGCSVTFYAVNRTSKISDYMIMDLSNGGATIEGYEVISSTQTDFTGEADNQEAFYGDYNASVRLGCNTYATYSDGKEGSPHVYIAKVNTCSSIDSQGGGATSVEYLSVNSDYYISNVFPNPVKDNLFVEFDAKKSKQLSIQVIDVKGSIVYKDQLGVTAGKKVYALELANIASGNYSLRVEDQAGVFNTRNFIKQ